jgi:hypothetical protein
MAILDSEIGDERSAAVSSCETFPHFLGSMIFCRTFQVFALEQQKSCSFVQVGIAFSADGKHDFSRPGRTIPRMVDSPAVIDLLFDTSWTRR